MPCYDLNGNAVPGTPQTCASLGGVWRDGVPQSLQQPEETVVAPGMNYHGKPIEVKFKYPNLFEDGGGTAVNTNKPQSAYSTTDINNSLKGINQFFHSAIDKEFDGGFMGFNPVNNIAHNSISKHMSSYNNPNQVTPAMIANTREMIRDKAGSRLGPQKTQYILDRFNRYAKKVEDYQKASGNIPVTSPTSSGGPLHFGGVGTSYGMGEGQQRSFAEPGLGYRDTDDFGNPLKTTNAFGDYQYDERVNRANQSLNHGLMRDYTNGSSATTNGSSATETPDYQAQFQMTPFVGADGEKMSVAEVKRQQEEGSLGDTIKIASNTVRNIPVVGAITDFLHYDPASMLSEAYTHITDPKLRADAIKFIDENGATATIGAYLTYRLGKKAKILKKIKEGLPQKPSRVPRGRAKPKALVPYNPGGVDAAKIAMTAAKGTIAASAIDQAIDNPWLQSRLEGTVFENKDSATGVVPEPTVDYTTAGGTGGAGTAKKSSIKWDEMAKLGQLMAHYGTPLSKRKEHPSKQWGTELAAAQTAAAKAAAAGNKTIFSNVGNKQHERALREKVAIKMGKDEWLATDPTEEELDAQVAESAIAINYLIANMKMSPAAAEELVLNSIK